MRPESKRSTEDVLKHEAGHVLDSRSYYMRQAFGIIPTALHPDAAKVRKRVGSTYLEARAKNPQYYAATNEAEHFAEVFDAGIEVLRRTAPHDPSDSQQFLEAVDDALPGTAEMVEYLLAQPVFAQHPLRRQREEQRSGVLQALGRLFSQAKF